MTRLPTHSRPNRVNGFTLIELLVGVTIFTIILAALFAVLVALQDADRFRDRYSVVTQGARYAFEPIVRSLKAADAQEVLRMAQGNCMELRGFYINDDGQPLKEMNLDNYATLSSVSLRRGQQLVAIAAEPIHDETNGPMKQWVKHTYELGDNDPDPDSGAKNQTIIEKVYKANNGFEWPLPLGQRSDNCVPGSVNHWKEVSSRKLTSTKVAVEKLNVRMASPVLSPAAEKSPFVTVEITVAHGDPKYSVVGTKTYVPKLTLRSTITPTFSYGVVHD